MPEPRGKYARNTKVPVFRSGDEVRALLVKYGATRFVQGEDLEAGEVRLAFEMEGRQIRMTVPMPKPEDFSERGNWSNQYGEGQKKESAYSRACAQRWRAIVLLVRAQLEAIECGAVTFDHAFLRDIVMPNGRTVGETIEPELSRALATGELPALMPGDRR